jgi:hypothetical protein
MRCSKSTFYCSMLGEAFLAAQSMGTCHLRFRLEPVPCSCVSRPAAWARSRATSSRGAAALRTSAYVLGQQLPPLHAGPWLRAPPVFSQPLTSPQPAALQAAPPALLW